MKININFIEVKSHVAPESSIEEPVLQGEEEKDDTEGHAGAACLADIWRHKGESRQDTYQ